MVRLGLKACYPKRFKVTTNSNHVRQFQQIALTVSLISLLQIKFGQLISLMFGHWKAGFMLQLLLIYFPDKLWDWQLQAICEQHCV